MSDFITERTAPVIAFEITTIKQQTAKIVLSNAIEIGKRLKEAKALMPYGEWGKWLTESVSYSERTAQKLMRVYEAYGEKEPTAIEANVSTPPLPDISYSQALILLEIPKEKREQFIAEMDIDTMSVRELQKAVKERETALQERDQALQEIADFQTALDNEKDNNLRLIQERDGLKTKADNLQRSNQVMAQDIEKRQLEVNKLKETTSYKSVLKMTDNLTVAYNKAAANKIAFLCENLDKAFKELSFEMSMFAKVDPEVHAAYKKQVNDFLIKAMQERLGG